MDIYFNYRNWITWSRRSPGKNKNNYKNNREEILYYTENKENFTFNKQKRLMTGKDVLGYKVNGEKHGWIFNEETGRRECWTEEGNVWYYTRPFWSMRENTEHPMQKPLKLCDRIILSSSNENNIVLDCFSGSGSFVLSAKNNNRQYIGIEKEKNYCDLIKERIKNKEKPVEYNEKQLLLI